MDRNFCFGSLLRDKKSGKSNGARRSGSTIRQTKERGVDSKIMLQRHCVVVDQLNNFEIRFQNGSCGPIKNVVLMRNMGFV